MNNFLFSHPIGSHCPNIDNILLKILTQPVLPSPDCFGSTATALAYSYSVTMAITAYMPLTVVDFSPRSIFLHSKEICLITDSVEIMLHQCQSS